MPAALSAWARWQAAAGPWRGWAVCPCLQVGAAGAHIVPLNEVPDVSRVNEAVAAQLATPGTAVLLDLDPALGVSVAAELSAQRLACVVLVLPRWPHAKAILPCDDLLAALLGGATLLRQAASPHNVVFITDADRRISVCRPIDDARIDNRYDLASGDLPNLVALRRAGVRRIVKVTRA